MTVEGVIEKTDAVSKRCGISFLWQLRMVYAWHLGGKLLYLRKFLKYEKI